MFFRNLAAGLIGLALLTPAWAETQEVSFENNAVHGTLDVPSHQGELAAVLLIAGSGPIDRDGNSVKGPIRPNMLKEVAGALDKAGIASLRYDKRAAELAKLAPADALAAERKLRFSDFVADAVAGAKFLAAQPDVECISILGHSQGALVGALAAAKVKTCGYISVAGAGVPIDVTLSRQLTAAGLDKAEIARVLEPMRHGKVATHIPPILVRVLNPSVQPFMISWMQYDPAKAVAAVPAPVLILQGETDLQVTDADAKALKRARQDAEMVLLDGVNHVLKTAPAARQANIATYLQPDLPLAPSVMPVIVKFIRSHSGAAHE